MVNYRIWITFENEDLAFEDFIKARLEISELGVSEKNLGVGLTMLQWNNFKIYASRFDDAFIFSDPTTTFIVGFPIKIIQEL